MIFYPSRQNNLKVISVSYKKSQDVPTIRPFNDSLIANDNVFVLEKDGKIHQQKSSSRIGLFFEEDRIVVVLQGITCEVTLGTPESKTTVSIPVVFNLPSLLRDDQKNILYSADLSYTDLFRNTLTAVYTDDFLNKMFALAHFSYIKNPLDIKGRIVLKHSIEIDHPQKDRGIVIRGDFIGSMYTENHTLENGDPSIHISSFLSLRMFISVHVSSDLLIKKMTPTVESLCKEINNQAAVDLILSVSA